MENLIEDIIEAIKMFELKTVNIFFSDKNEKSEIAASLALKEYLNYLEVPASIIAEPEKIDNRREYPSFLTEYGTEVEKDEFLSVIVNCPDYYRVNTMKCLDTYITFSVCAPSPNKDYGVKNYTAKKGITTPEIMFREIENYAIKHDKPIPKNVCDYLYMAIVSVTARYQKFTTSNLMDTASKLLKYGAEYRKANYEVEKIDSGVFECQKELINNLDIDENKFGIVILNKRTVHDLSQYESAMEFFRTYEDMPIFICFVKLRGSNYRMIIHGRHELNFDYSLVEEFIDLDINDNDAYANVKEFQIVQILKTISTVYKEFKRGRKPLPR